MLLDGQSKTISGSFGNKLVALGFSTFPYYLESITFSNTERYILDCQVFSSKEEKENQRVRKERWNKVTKTLTEQKKRAREFSDQPSFFRVMTLQGEQTQTEPRERIILRLNESDLAILNRIRAVAEEERKKLGATE